MSTFSVLFLAALLIATGMRLWLATRHVQHILAHRDAVPTAFADEISLEAHRKAADYSIAKTRVNIAAIGAALGLPLLFAVLWLMAEMGEMWWLYVWIVWVVFNTLVLALYPTFIAPLFNKFSPMQDGEMKQRIENLISRCGFTSKGLF